MKKVDFSKTGGMPITQNLLDYLQLAYNEQITALAKGILQDKVTSLQPVVLYGMVYNNFSATVTAGAFYYNGEIILFPGASYPTGAGQEAAVSITTNTSTLAIPFNNGNTPAVKTEKTSTLVLQATGTAATASQVAFSSFIYAYEAIGRNRLESGFSTTTIGAPGMTGSLLYKKDVLNNTLQLKCTMNISVAGIISSDPQPYSVVNAALPTAYRPAADTPFSAYYRYHNSAILDDTGKDYIRQINCELQTTGFLSVGLLKAAADYSLYFNTIIPLD